MPFRLFLISGFTLLCFSCNPSTSDKADSHLGVVEFKVTGKKADQPFLEILIETKQL